jgi:CII-binding regulator of phage lambda lysogenization HflD
LAARWDKDTTALKLDLLSILVGVNNTTLAVYGDKNYTVSSYEDGYRALLTQTLQQLPQTKLVILAQFILSVGKVKERWDDYQREISGRQAVAKKQAPEFSAIFLPLQDSFNKISAKYPPDIYWLWMAYTLCRTDMN